MRYRLRSLVIATTICPPLLAGVHWFVWWNPPLAALTVCCCASGALVGAVFWEIRRNH
jgi:hypothetical protein